MGLFKHALKSLIFEDVTDVSQIGETLAYTWFGRPNALYSYTAQKYWIGSTKDVDGFGTTQHITEYDIIENTYTSTQVGTVNQKDDHNQAQILIRESDKRLMAFYSEHIGAAIRYRISDNPLNASSWSAEITLNPLGGYSYVSPYQGSNGNIFIFYRTYYNSQFEWYYQKSTDNGLTFGSPVKLYADSGNKAYLISCQDGDKIHFVASDGHPQTDGSKNVSVNHFYFDMSDETAHKSNGNGIALPLSAAQLTTVATTYGIDTSWVLDVTIKNGLPRVLFTKYPDGHSNNLLNKDLYFKEFNGTDWVNETFIARTLSGYMEDDTTIQEYGYMPASRFDVSNPDIIWMSKQVNGITEIHKVDMSLTPIYIEQLTFDSTVNNWRPISVPSPVNNLLWLKNNDYNYYTDYSISLQAKTVKT
jgi:hypothetical protein